MIVVIWILVATAALVLYLRESVSKWSKAGINHLPAIPFFGNSHRLIFLKENMYKHLQRTYNAFPEDRVCGLYEFFTPGLMVRDVELLKKIVVKDSEFFINRREILNGIDDPFLSRSMFIMKGEEWKDMRSSLSPAFTSSKIRLMVPFMVEVGHKIAAVIRQRIRDSEVGYIDVDFKDLSSRYANDVIATCAFGLKVDSQSDDQFYNMTKLLISLSPKRIVKFLTFRGIPVLNKSMDLALISRKAYAFFRDVILSTISMREEQNIFRNDMIHLLMEAKKGRLVYDSKDKQDADAGFSTVEESEIGKMQRNREWTDNDLVSQAILFLFAGYETVSTTMSFLAHELATHPEAQERLLQEIRENEDKNDGKFDYSCVQNMKYMDMVVSEVLRMYPPLPSIDRSCMKNYNIGRPNKNSKEDYIMKPGEPVHIPVWSFHHDENYFPDPYKFDPERFSDENKHNIKPFTYMPFGLGPRNCIGSRFALCEVKVMTYQLLKHFHLSACEKTCQPTELQDERVTLRIKGGYWVRLKLRE